MQPTLLDDRGRLDPGVGRQSSDVLDVAVVGVRVIVTWVHSRYCQFALIHLLLMHGWAYSVKRRCAPLQGDSVVGEGTDLVLACGMCGRPGEASLRG